MLTNAGQNEGVTHLNKLVEYIIAEIFEND
jgi:hypothetical protein